MIFIRINLLYDPNFKSLAMSVKARKRLSYALSSITGISYDEIYHATFRGGPIPKQNHNEKGKESDLIIHVRKNLVIIVEMNYSFRPSLFEEKSDYAFSILTRSTRKNGKYTKVILVSIDNFNAFKTNRPIEDVAI